jgi:hypothetical protein
LSGSGGARLSALLGYARDASRCRRRALLELLGHVPGDDAPGGDAPGGECCDVCSGLSGSLPREEPGVLDFFRRNARRHSVREAAAVLSRAPGFFWSPDESGRVIRHLLGEGKLARSGPLFGKALVLADGRRGRRKGGAIDGSP